MSIENLRARNSEVTDPIRPEFELVRDFMPVLVTSKFDEDPIKNERASLETPFSHYKSMGNFSDAQGEPNSVGSGPIWPKFKLVRDFMPVLFTYKFEKNLIKKTTEKRWRHRFPHYKSMGAFCCHGNSFDPICPKILRNLSPTLMMLHIKFDQHWPTGLRYIQVSSELWQNDRKTEFRKDKANPV